MRGALTGVFSAWLGLIALHAVGTSSGRISVLFKDANAVLEHVLDPKVPAIPDLRTAGVGDTGTTSGSTVADGRGYVRPPSSAAGSTTPSSTVADGRGYVRPPSNAAGSTGAAGSTAARYNLGRVGGR